MPSQVLRRVDQPRASQHAPASLLCLMAIKEKTAQAEEGGMEFLSLSTACPDVVGKLLRHEARLWHDRLGWDTTGLQRVLYQAVCRRTLPGILARDGDRPAGLAYYTTEGGRGVLGTLVVAQRYRNTSVGQQLAHAVVGKMHGGGALRRVESHTPFAGESGAGSAFRALGFKGVPRLFLTKPLATVSRSSVPDGIAIEPLDPRRRHLAAEVIYSSMAGSRDAALSAEFESVDGCQRHLETLMIWPGLGRFEQAASAIATNGQGHAIGVIATTLLSRTRALVGQISVRPEYQARGVGHALMSHAWEALAAMGIEDVTLTVTEENPARDWYFRLGFRELHSFDAYVWREGDSTESPQRCVEATTRLRQLTTP